MFPLLSSDGKKMDHLLHEVDGNRQMANQIVRQVFHQRGSEQEKLITGANVSFRFLIFETPCFYFSKCLGRRILIYRQNSYEVAVNGQIDTVFESTTGMKEL